MKKFRNRKVRISILLILALAIQLIGPIVVNQAIADENHEQEEELSVTDATEEVGEFQKEKGGESEEELEEIKEEESTEDEEEPGEEQQRSKIQPLANGGKDLGNIFTFEYLKLGGQDGEAIEDGQIIDIKDGTEVAIQFKWDTVGKDAKAGDWAAMGLPDIFEELNVSNQPIIVGGIQVGAYSVIGRELKLVFNESIEDEDIKNGYVGFKLEFNLEKFKENIEQEITFNDSKDTTLNIMAKPKVDLKDIDKEGHPDKEKDAREITWTIDILNPGKEEITNAIVKDNIPEGLELQEDSFVVKELSVGYEGNKIVGVDGVGVSPNITEDGFEISFDGMKAFKGYRIEYKTTITDYSLESFTNDATLSYNEKELPAEATVSGLTRSDHIEKDGRYHKDGDYAGLIEWQIYVNKSANEIDNAIVEDNLPVGLSIVEGSIDIFKLDGEDWVESDKIASEFPVALGKLESNDAYVIRFFTDIDYSQINNGDYQDHNEFINKAKLWDGDTELGGDHAKVEIWRANILRKEGVSNVNYEDKSITWTVHVNEANHPLENITVTDMLPEGLAISKENIKIYKNYNIDEDVSDADKITIKEIMDGANKGKTEVKIDLGDIGTDYYKIVYTTTIENFTIDNFGNGVFIGGNGIGEGGHTQDNSNVKPPINTFNKAFKGIDYENKTMNWELKIDPKREAITELTIKDTFPNKGMILLPDTLVVMLGKDKLVKGTDYTLKPNEVDDQAGYNKGFVLEFDEKYKTEPLNNTITVTYQTSYDPQKEVDGKFLDPHVGEGEAKVYKNKATFSGNTENNNKFTDIEKEAAHTVRQDSWNSGKKEGQLVHGDEEGKLVNGWVSGKERKVAWQLYTNYQKQNLGNNVVITDTLDYEGRIDEDSIKVSVYKVDKAGNTIITDEVLGSDKYDVAVDGKEFTLTFKEEVTERYVVEFTTTVPNISQEKYVNKATIKFGDKELPYSGTVSYNKYNKFLDKFALVEGKDVYTGDEIGWELIVNENLSAILKDVKITDTISKGLVYINDSLQVYKLDGVEEEELEKGIDYTLETSTNDDGETILTIEFIKDVNNALILRYKTAVTETDGEVSNKVELEGNNIEIKTVESEKLNASQFSWVGGEFDPKKGALMLKKVDAEEKDDDHNKVVIDNNEATFTLEYDLNGERVQFGEDFTTKNGILEIGGLPLRTYYLKEKEAPKGYLLSEEEIEVRVTRAYNNKEENIVKVEFENTKEKIDITGNKVWEGGPGVRPTIKLQLYRNGEKHGDPVELKDGKTEYTWKDLDKTNKTGEEYKYTLNEVEVPENYNKELSKDGLTIINTYIIPKTEITGRKVWVDGPEIKPEIELQLFRNGEEYGVPVTLEADEAEYTWKDLDLTDKAGEEYKYTVDEVEVPKNYTKEISKDGLTVTNTYVSPKTVITGKKEWKGGPKTKPTIELQLYRNGEEYGDPVELKNGQTEYTWEDLDLTDKRANEYTYTVDEVNIPENYVKEVDHLTITNSYVIPKADISVNKKWIDLDKNNRPEEITVRLLQNNQVIEEIKLSEENDWRHKFTDLDKTDKDGNEYEYTVEETKVEGYITSISGNIENGFTITNTMEWGELEPGYRDIEVEKKWSGKALDQVKIILLANGEEIDSIVLNEENGWKHSFEKLPVVNNISDEKIIDYTIEEEEEENYKQEISGNMADGFIVTNTYVNPEPEYPEEPEEPGKPEEPEDPKGTEKPEEPKQETYPKTGEANNIALYLIGGVFIILGFMLKKEQYDIK